MKKEKHNVNLKSYSQMLRKNMTKEEKKLWYDFLKSLPVQFYRQRIIGNYIVDFYCAEKRIVIELDGSQHFEEENERKDGVRDEYLNSLGITVLRFSNRDVNEKFASVCECIYNFTMNQP